MAEPIDTDAFRKRHHPVNPVRYDGDTDGLVTDGPAVCPRCATQGWPCDASRLAAEVDRLRAENAALERKCEQLTLHSLGCPASPGTSCEFTDHGPCLVHSLRAENTALTAAVADLIAAVRAIPRHEQTTSGPEGPWCEACDTADWPCPTERAHRALDALEATDG